MFSISQPNQCRFFRASLVAAIWTLGLLFFGSAARAQSSAESSPVATSDRVLTSFEEIWQLPPSEQQQWQRVRLSYIVYYYDALWQAMWGRGGESESYLSLGSQMFPIKPGQRILVEGLMKPARGMRIESPTVSILEENVPLTAISTTGEVENTQRFGKRLVTIEGYVDRQTPRDANHVEISLIAEGRSVLVQLLLKNDEAIPQLRNKFIRAKGVYFARTDDSRGGAKIEVWVQRPEDIDVTGTLDRDPRFDLPETPVAKLAGQSADGIVRVSGTVQAQLPGTSVTLRNGDQEVVIHTPQTLKLQTGEQVEAVGFPGRENGQFVLRQSLLRPMHTVFTNVADIWLLPEEERAKSHPVRFDMVVLYFDPIWKGFWGQSPGARADYLSLGDHDFSLKPGQRVLIEGSVVLTNNTTIEDARVTVVEKSVPIEVISTRDEIQDTQKFDRRMVTVEGYVDRQGASRNRHVQLDLVVDGHPVIVRLLHEEGVTVPMWDGARLNLRGMYCATRDPNGGAPTIEIWTQGLDDIEVVGSLDSDARFKNPLSPIEKISSTAAGTPVRIAGVVRSQQPGKSITIRDETGQVDVETVQARLAQIGGRVEVAGVILGEGTERKLGDALFRKSQIPLQQNTDGLPKIRLADQLRELSPEEAGRSYPVQLSGVITWARPDADFFYIRDASGGVCVYRPTGTPLALVAGRRVELSGVSGSGRFMPVVMATEVQQLGTVDLPDPRPVTLEQALTGVEEAQWITMSGYVRRAVHDGPWTRLDLTTFGGEFHAMLPRGDLSHLVGAVVRLSGVCSAVTNQKRQLTDIQLWVASTRFIEIEEAVPTDPYTVATRSIASLRQFSSLEALNRRVRIAGVVVHHDPGRMVNIQEGSEGLLVLSRDVITLRPGDQIEAVGFPGRENSRLVLREAVYRKISAGEQPTPLRLTSLSPIDGERDGSLVQIDGTLVDIGVQESGSRLILQNNGTFFEARVERSKNELPDSWVPGSRMELTGVYQIEFDEYRRPHAVRLQLRTISDARVLQSPSGLTVKRVLGVTGLLAVCVVLGFGWVIALRRRVRQQTDVIRDQLGKEKAARLDAALARASKLESVGVLAGGIAHDFNNLLTVVIGNLSLAKMDGRIEPDTIRFLDESEKAAARAKDLTQQLLTFSKGGEPVRISTRLPDIVREATQFGLHGSNVRSEFHIAPDLWAVEVDKGQIAQVVHNLIINASQAMPSGGLIGITLENHEAAPDSPRPGLTPGRYVRISISDTGVGIGEENLARIFDPYFSTKPQGSGLGLATVYSIVKKHQGHIDVVSKVGQGTTFNVWIPAALKAPAASASSADDAGKPGRVLIMDDELSIRQLGSAVIKRMGLEVTAVNDGTSVVEEYAAATASGRPYDLVILDLTVPGGMGGAEAMQRLRKMDGKVRAIVSSGYSSDPVMANHVQHGFSARVPKPYTATDLIQVVTTVMKNGR